MKKPIIYFILFFFMVLYVNGQELKRPDYNKIKIEIQSKESSSYYPKLLERFRQFDTLMTNDEYHYLYYGYVHQEAYNPYKRFSKEGELKQLLEKESFVKEDYEKIMHLYEDSFEEFPFNLVLLDAIAYICDETGYSEEAQKAIISYRNILNTVFLSGDGLSCDTSFHVLVINHEYLLLDALEIVPESQELLGMCDFLYLDPEEYTIEGVYFDVTPMMKRNQILMQTNQ